jgi:hypothetical protein
MWILILKNILARYLEKLYIHFFLKFYSDFWIAFFNQVFFCNEHLFPLFREKLKINAVSGQLDETFNDMLNKY